MADSCKENPMKKTGEKLLANDRRVTVLLMDLTDDELDEVIGGGDGGADGGNGAGDGGTDGTDDGSSSGGTQLADSTKTCYCRCGCTGRQNGSCRTPPYGDRGGDGGGTA